MQSDDLKEDYNKKLDDIIEFFKTEKETGTFNFDRIKEDNKFNYNVFLTIIVILITASTIISNFDKQFNIFVLIFISMLLLFLVFYMTNDSSSSKKINNDFIHESIKFNWIISFLQSLKILQYEVDLSKLINKINNRYHFGSPSFLNEEYIMKTWFEEIDGCLGDINKEILEKEKNLLITKQFKVM